MADLWMDVDAALSEVPVNIMPLLDDTDFKTREEAITYDQAGLELIWHFTTTAGATSATVVTPTTAGVYDWVHQDGGMYTIEIPASGGASINNDTEGFGWFTGVATGVLPWRGPVIGFRAAGLNNVLIDTAYSATRGLSGTALPDAVADAAGGLAISDAGGLDLDTKLANTNEVTAARMGALTDWINGGRLDLLLDAIKAVTDNLPDSGALTTIGTDTARLTAARAGVLDDWLNAGRLDAILDIIAADVVNLDGAAMRGTDSAALASVCTEARLATLTDWIDGGRLDVLLDKQFYQGPQGAGVFLDDGAANTNTVVGVDGIESNPVSTIAAATTIAGSLGIQRIYLINDSVITLAQTYEGWEFIGIGLGNQITLGSQDVDNSCFSMLTLTGTQGGTGALYCEDCSMTGLVSLECIAYRCYLSDTCTVRASTLIIFDQCKSAVPGNNTPELTFSGGASNVNFRHYSGGLQLNSMGTGDTMSFETDGQIVIDASCTDGLLTVRGCCDITDNASGAVTITQSAAINQANINAEVDTGISDAALATAANLATVDTVVDGIKAVTDLLPDAGALNDLAAILADTGTTLPATLAALNDVSTAEVNAEVVDVLKVDTMTLPGQEAPSLTPTMEEALALQHKIIRNRKAQTATQWSLYADDESTVDAKATVSDDGTTAIKQEIVTGP